MKHLTYIIPNVITQVEEISLKDIEKKYYKYEIFPRMDPSLYVKIKKPKIKYQSRFEVAKDEVKINDYKILRLNNKIQIIIYIILLMNMFFISNEFIVVL
jgi:hypothetical protein